METKIIRCVILGILLGSLFLPSGVVSAHAYLVQSTPAANAHLQRSPERIDMIFSEAVESSLSDIAVYDSNGVRVDNHQTRVDPADPTHVWNSLPPLKDGAYLVTWKVISKSDGHLTGEGFPFVVGNIAEATPSLKTPSGEQPAALPGQVIVKGLLYLAVALLCGGTLFERFIWLPALQRAGKAGAELALYQINRRRFILVGIILLGAASLLGVLVQAAAFEGKLLPTLWDSENLVVLGNTQYGILALTRIVLLLALAGLLLPLANSWNRWTSLPFLALTALTLSLGSHANAQSNFLMVSDDLIHTLAASVWTGGLAAFLISLLWTKKLPAGRGSRLVPALLARFSTLAIASVILLTLTGVYSGVIDVGSLSGLVATEYGRVLIIKLAAVLVMIAVGGYNHFVMTPQLEQDAAGARKRFQKLLVIETALGALILLWVGFFTSLPMANEDAAIPGISRATRADDLWVKLVISPGRAGVINTFTLELSLAADGSPLTNASEVNLLIYPSNDAIPPSTVKLSSIGQGKYVARGAYLTYQDEWQVRGVIRRPQRYDTYPIFYINTKPPLSLSTNVSMIILAVSAGLAGMFDLFILFKPKSLTLSHPNN